MQRRRPPPEDLTLAAARQQALALLSGRELTTAELAARLRRRGFPPDVADAALRALAADGLLDDRRAARARARHDAVIRRHGPNRILRQVEALGVDRETARDAVRAAFEEVDEDAVLAQAIARRLRGAPIPSDPPARRRLHAWLLRQGFDPGKVAARLRRRGGDAED